MRNQRGILSRIIQYVGKRPDDISTWKWKGEEPLFS